MRLGGVHRLAAVGRQPGTHRRRQLVVDRLALGIHAQPVGLAVRGRAAAGLGVGIGRAPALLRLGGVLVRVHVAEDLEPLLGGQVDSHLSCLHRLLDGRRHTLQPPDPIQQQPVLAPEVDGGVGAAIGHHRLDLVEVLTVTPAIRATAPTVCAIGPSFAATVDPNVTSGSSEQGGALR